MNPVEKVLRRADAAQQRHQPTAFVFGVVKKFGDDNGGVLVTNLAYAAFVSIFPLLLILVTVLVNIAATNPSLRNEVISGATTQFPLIGKQLASNIHVLRRSTAASLTVGLLLLAWGVIRLAQAGLFAMEQVWNLPGPARPGYLPRLGRSAEFLGLLALGVAISTLLAGLVTYGHHALAFRMLAQVLAAVANIGMYFLGFRVLTPKGVRSRQLLAGAVAGGTFGPAADARRYLVTTPAQRPLRDLRFRARPGRLDLFRRAGHCVRGRDQRRAGPPPLAAGYRPATADRSRPGIHGGAGAAESAAARTADPGHLQTGQTAPWHQAGRRRHRNR